MRKAGGQSAAMVAAGMIMTWPAAAAAAARDWDLRDSYGLGRLAPVPSRRPYGPIADLLGSADQVRIAGAWSTRSDVQSGTVDLTMFTTSLRSIGSRDDSSLVDRYVMRTGGFRATTPLIGDLSLWGSGSMSLVKRHYELTPAGARGLSTIIATAGLGIARRDRGWLGLEYIDAAARRLRTPVDRLIEQARGGPGTSNGMRLTLSTATPGDAWRRPSWSFGLAALRRPLIDNPSGTGGGSIADNRAEIRFRLPL
jgi:hypothetical protein